MDIRIKLPLAFAAVLALTLLAGGGGLWQAQRSMTVFEIEVQGRHADVRAADDLESHFKTQVQEWKNVLLRGSDTALLDKHWKAFEKEEKLVDDNARALRLHLDDAGEQALVDAFLAAHAKMAQAYRGGLEKFKGSGMESSVGDLAVRGIDREPAQLLNKLQTSITERSAAVAAQAAAAGRQAIGWSVGLMLAAMLAGIGIAVVISRQVSASLQAAIDAARRVAAGDLRQAIDARGSDEPARLLQALSEMQAHLRDLVSQVRAGAESVAAASGQIAQGNGDLAGRTERQASELQMAASSMSDLGDTVRRNADNARQATGLAATASEVAQRGGQVVHDMVSTMRAIDDSAKRIADIIGVIDGIAFQTNILALNAAVEAARAGESGRGFAVVASEVRSLAQRSADAAREIKSLIQASVERVGQGNELAGLAGHTMQEVVTAIGRVDQIIREISQASDEQSAGVGAMGQAVARMDGHTQQNAALVEQTSAASESLSRQATALVERVSTFRT
ncbi:HAMP domain-containing protein [Ideonella sp. 4Y16]|uniref:methyl-accepting chemotaxis protein n=1 Tax=Ideonella alba TaxID=2824118 RepID=UPI001B359A59|nr:methyl-accepting chemotaxis protein [Ideonella alba]MBQ0943780.1 HAMP domain-containing protein [Ideonella alba]